MRRKKTPSERKGTSLNIKEYGKYDRSKLGKTYLKYYRLACQDIRRSYGVNQYHIEMLLFVYDLEYFTANHVTKSFGLSRSETMRKSYIHPLLKKELLFVYMSHGDISDEDRQRFNIAPEEGFRARYAISQKGRYMIQKLYSKLEGRAPIFIDD